MKLKFENLELEIEGAREDASLLTRNAGQQIAQLLAPMEGIVDARPKGPDLKVIETPPTIDQVNGKSRRRRNSGSTAPNSDGEIAIDFNLQPEKFGNPKQDWKTADKALWLLYVLKESQVATEVTTRSLVLTFNKHFRQAGTITTSNVTRDLGRLKVRVKPAPVGEDTTKTPSPWYLTEEGRKQAQSLVAAALGQAN